MRQKAFSADRMLALLVVFLLSFSVQSTSLLAEKISSTSTRPPPPPTTMPPYDYQSQHFENFLKNIEELVMNTTDRALIVTKNVYLELNRTMPQSLRDATKTLIATYIGKVDWALKQQNASYIDKRKLLQQFRANNRHIQQLRKQIAPQVPEFQFQLISGNFYSDGQNSTEFDNLYLEFMQKFANESQQLWKNLTERTVEEQEELLEIIDEIDSEQKLNEKDKLFDEFIERFLFKPQIESRELE